CRQQQFLRSASLRRDCSKQDRSVHQLVRARMVSEAVVDELRDSAPVPVMKGNGSQSLIGIGQFRMVDSKLLPLMPRLVDLIRVVQDLGTLRSQRSRIGVKPQTCLQDL